MSDNKSSGGLWETIRVVFYAVLIAFFIRTVAFEPFNIPSGSMVPTLLVGDYLFVSKFSYGYSRYSLPLGLPLFDGRIFADEPERGDVAVFRLPRDDSTDYMAVERRRIEDYSPPSAVGASGPMRQYIEVLPNGREHRIVEATDNGAFDNTREYLVPEGHYFAMGDNRDNSQDSRFAKGVGFVPAQNLVGRAEILFFSANGGARIWEVWKWPWGIRYSRIFDLIE